LPAVSTPRLREPTMKTFDGPQRSDGGEPGETGDRAVGLGL
jgi:hypothetical protein